MMKRFFFLKIVIFSFTLDFTYIFNISLQLSTEQLNNAWQIRTWKLFFKYFDPLIPKIPTKKGFFELFARYSHFTGEFFTWVTHGSEDVFDDSSGTNDPIEMNFLSK